MSNSPWRFSILLGAIFAYGCIVAAQPASTAAPHDSTDKPAQGEWGDQGDGTYTNPILPADFSDLDAIRVDGVYYAISSTFQYSPGMAILASKDLVNWRMIGHAVDDLTRISPQMNWDKMGRAGRGIWAGSIRYHAGKYWIYFGTPDEGLFMTSAIKPIGPWSPPVLILPSPGWDDPCPFWDDNGQGYLVTTHFTRESSNGSAYNIHLFKLSRDGTGLATGFDRIIHRSEGSEANKLYKIQGRYYHYYSQVTPEGRVPMMERALSLDGPWQAKQLGHVNPAVDKEPNQGGLIQIPSGKWYFVTHQGTGDWEGRAAVLLPITWIDGWPILGKPGPDGIGNMVWSDRKPIQGLPRSSPVASDDFNHTTLKPGWEWNYQPRADKWSLTEHPGSLRLHAFPPLRADDFAAVGNVLTQRSMRTKSNQVTVKLDLGGMANGQQAGIAHYAETYSTLSIVQKGTRRTLEFDNNGSRQRGPEIQQPAIWLRSTWDFDGLCRYSYSIDGQNFQPVGDSYQLTWGHYRGDRIAIFTTNQKAETGYVDIDSFHYEVSR